MTVSLLEILGAARVHAAPLAAESAGYLLLAVADHVVAAPRLVSPEDVELSPDGSVRLRARRGAATDGPVERGLRQLLGRTLEVASSVGPALRRAAQRTEDAGLPALVRELETALIPVNRSAAKRALSRLHRETERAKSAGKLAKAAEVAPVVAQPVVVQPVVAEPVVAEPVVAEPVVAEPVVAEPVDFVTEYPEALPLVLPLVQTAALPPVEPSSPRPLQPKAPTVELTLTPEPLIAVGEAACTKPEPVVQRAKERGSSTPRLGTLITLQTLPGEEIDRTERAPDVLMDGESELDLSIDVELEPDFEPVPEAPAVPDDEAVTPDARLAALSQPLVDPEPSRMPDVLTAMVELHTGIDADEAPTRLREVVTALRLDTASPAPAEVAGTPSVQPAEVAVAPAEVAVAPAEVAVAPAEVAITPADAAVTPAAAPASVAAPLTADAFTPVPASALAAAPASDLAPTPAPELVEDIWLSQSSLREVTSAPILFHSELAAPEVHEALTWNPGPVVLADVPVTRPPALVIAEPLPEPSPYAPAVLPTLTSDVSDLLDTFHVSSAAEERDLRSALKEMAGLELTPLPHPLVEEG